MKVRVLSPALDEIAEAAQWLDSQRAGLGHDFWQAVETILKRIETHPLGFARSDFATPERDLRFTMVRPFNYVVHFLILEHEILVVSVAHGARRSGYWLRRIDR